MKQQRINIGDLGFRVVTYLDGQNDKNIHDGLKAVIKNHYGDISS